MTAKETWKPVTIGGLTGIMMGAGAMYGVQAMTSGNNDVVSGAEAEELKVASVDDGQSFSKAFEAARAEVGAGGVFTWRGHIYNTYTAEEWKALSHEDQNQFADRVKPEVSPADIDTNQIAEAGAEPANDADVQIADNDVHIADNDVQIVDDDVQIAQNVVQQQDHDVEVQQDSNAETDTKVIAQAATWNDLAQNENDVRIVGFKEIEVGHGRSIAMQELDINGQRVAVIDVDKDGDPDLAMSDLNHNHQMDEGEVIDLHTGETLSFADNDPALDNVPDLDTFSA